MNKYHKNSVYWIPRAFGICVFFLLLALYCNISDPDFQQPTEDNAVDITTITEKRSSGDQTFVPLIPDFEKLTDTPSKRKSDIFIYHAYTVVIINSKLHNQFRLHTKKYLSHKQLISDISFGLVFAICKKDYLPLIS